MKKDKAATFNLEKRVKGYMHNHEQTLEYSEGKLKEDFCYAFQWGHCESAYRASYLIKQIKLLLKVIESDDKDKVSDWLKSVIDMLRKELLNGRVIKSSTSQSSNISHLYEIECKAELLDKYDYWLREIEEGRVQIRETISA